MVRHVTEAEMGAVATTSGLDDAALRALRDAVTIADLDGDAQENSLLKQDDLTDRTHHPAGVNRSRKRWSRGSQAGRAARREWSHVALISKEPS